jgi:hypothetical protein
VAGGQPLHDVGQPPVRQFQRRLAQRGQLTDQAAADHDRNEDGQDHREEAQPARQDEFQVGSAGVGRCLRGDRVRRLGAGLGQTRSHAPDRSLPLLGQDGRGAAHPRVGHEPVFQRGQGGGSLRADVAGVVRAVLRLQVRKGLGVQRPPGPGQLGELLAVRRGERPRGQVARDDRAFLQHQVLGPAHPDEGQGLGDQVGVRLLKNGLVDDRVAVRDDGVVLVEGP